MDEQYVDLFLKNIIRYQVHDIFRIIVWGVVGLSVLLAGLTIIRFKAFSGYLRYYGLWIINSAFMETAAKLLVDLDYQNLFLFHINAVIEYTLLVLIFDHLLKDIGQKGIHFILFPGIAAILLNSIFVQTPHTFNSYSLTLISLATVLVCVYYFFLLSDMSWTLDKKMFQAILIGAIFILHISSLLPILFGNHLVLMDLNEQYIVWLLRACIVLVVKIILFYTLLSYVFTEDLQDTHYER